MFCKNCGAQLNNGQAVCLNCGVKVGVGSSFCQNCGNVLNQGADVCLNCGASVRPVGSSNLAGQDKTLIIILCIFLGTLGIHNFVMGETKKGVLKLVLTFCTAGTISLILMIVDLIKICNDTYVVDPNALI